MPNGISAAAFEAVYSRRMPTEPPGSALDAAIDRLYAAFGTVPRPAAIDLCPCCMTEPEAAELRDLLQHGTRLKHGAMPLTNAFWGSSGAQVVQWLNGVAVRTAVAEAMATTDAEASLQALAEVDDLLAVYGR
jgi:hypothetical protein